MFYVLDAQHQPQPASTEDWAFHMNHRNSSYQLSDEVGRFRIFTAFRGVAGGAKQPTAGGAAPAVFTSAINFASSVAALTDLRLERYTTWADAVAGHAALVAEARAGTVIPGKDPFKVSQRKMKQ